MRDLRRFNFFIGLLLLSVVTSCAVEAPEFTAGDGFKIEKMEDRQILFSAGIKVDNPNWFAIKLKRSSLDVYMDDQLLGKLQLEKKVKMKAKKESEITLPLRASLEEGAMMMIFRNATKENVTIRFKGKVKGGVWIFSKKIAVDETRQVPGKFLRPGGFQKSEQE